MCSTIARWKESHQNMYCCNTELCVVLSNKPVLYMLCTITVLYVLNNETNAEKVTVQFMLYKVTLLDMPYKGT